MEKIYNIDSYENYEIITYVSGGYWKQNCYLIVFSDKSAIVIDPGYDTEDIIDYVNKCGYTIKNILITHAHHDHLANACVISEYFSIPCIIHPADRKLYMHASLYSMRFAGRSLTLPKNIVWLDEIIINNLKLNGVEILSSPGHTYGGISIFYKNVVFTGDSIMKNCLGRTDLPEGNKELLIKSISTFFRVASEKNISVIYPGHQGKWAISEAFDWYKKQNEF